MATWGGGRPADHADGVPYTWFDAPLWKWRCDMCERFVEGHDHALTKRHVDKRAWLFWGRAQQAAAVAQPPATANNQTGIAAGTTQQLPQFVNPRPQNAAAPGGTWAVPAKAHAPSLPPPAPPTEEPPGQAPLPPPEQRSQSSAAAAETNGGHAAEMNAALPVPAHDAAAPGESGSMSASSAPWPSWDTARSAPAPAPATSCDQDLAARIGLLALQLMEIQREIRDRSSRSSGSTDRQ